MTTSSERAQLVASVREYEPGFRDDGSESDWALVARVQRGHAVRALKRYDARFEDSGQSLDYLVALVEAHKERATRQDAAAPALGLRSGTGTIQGDCRFDSADDGVLDTVEQARQDMIERQRNAYRARPSTSSSSPFSASAVREDSDVIDPEQARIDMIERAQTAWLKRPEPESASESTRHDADVVDPEQSRLAMIEHQRNRWQA